MNFTSLDNARSYAEAIFPELKEMNTDVCKQGNQSWTLLYPDRVVQIPRNSAVFEGMKTSKFVLDKLRDQGLGSNPFINIPEVLYFDGDNRVIILSRLAGKTPDFSLSADPVLQKEFGQRLGYFLAMMHDGMSDTVAPDQHSQMLTNIASQVDQILETSKDQDTLDRLKKVLKYVEGFDDIDDGWAYIHGDVSPANTTYCTKGGFGLVDFTSTFPFYRHMDFARIQQKFPSVVLEESLKVYQRKTGRYYDRELIAVASDWRTILTSQLKSFQPFSFHSWRNGPA